MSTFQDSLNNVNPNQLADLLRDLKLGNLVRSLPVKLNKQAPAAGALTNGNLTTLDVIHLPDNAKAAFILRAEGRAGGTVGEFSPQAYGATPTTTQCAVTPNGDIAFVHTTDLVTDIDVLYVPQQGDVYEFTGNLATGVLTIPASIVARGVLMLLEADIVTGTVTGPKTVLVPLAGGGAGLPATTKAQLTSNKSTVSFNNATDAGTVAHVKLLVAAAASSVDAVLQATATY